MSSVSICSLHHDTHACNAQHCMQSLAFLLLLMPPCTRSFGGDLEPDEKRDRLGRSATSAGAVSDDEDAPVNGSEQQGGAATAVIDVDAEPAGDEALMPMPKPPRLSFSVHPAAMSAHSGCVQSTAFMA